MNSDPFEQERYRATLSRQEIQWQAQYDFIMHCDRLAGDIGISGLKTAVLINAGALVALLALIGQMWEKNAKLVAHIMSSSEHFVWGLALASLDFLVAYFYQSTLTAQEWHKLEIISGKAQNKWFRYFVGVLAIIMILLAMASLGEFVWGILSIVHIFQSGAANAV